MSDDPGTALGETWTWREMPILRAALTRSDVGELVGVKEIAADTGLDRDQVRSGFRALGEGADPPFLLVDAGHVEAVCERTRRLLGTWPTAEDLVDDIARAIAEAADEEEEPERKGRLREAAEAVGGGVRDIAVQVIAPRLGQS